MDSQYNIIFSHAVVDDLLSAKKGKYHGTRRAIQDDGRLNIETGLDDITWGYGLNSITYPTYGGEVVQNLSAYIDDMEITGTAPNYAVMEEIYLWNLTYMTVATQGFRLGGDPNYNEDDVDLWIPFRGWNFKIRPKSLPGFRYATELVAPEWRMTAAIMESDAEILEATIQNATDDLGRISAGIGYEELNPFSAPSPNSDGYKTQTDVVNQIGDQYSKIVNQFSSGDLSAITDSPSGAPDAPKTATQTKPKN